MLEIDRAQVIAYLCFSVIYSLIGIPANSLSLTFFLTKRGRDHISRFIFILLNLTDLFICLCFILLTISYVSLLRGEKLVESPVYCTVYLATFPTAQQFSVFITAVLCLVRTISIVKPLLNISKKVIFGIISIYLCFIIVRVILLFKDSSLRASFRPKAAKCGWEIVQTGQLADFSRISLILISLILVPSILGCLVTVCWLRRSSQEIPIAPSKRRAAITVMILTTICLLASSTFVVERMMRMRGMEVSAVMENVALQFAYSFTCVANPTVYFIRLKKLRLFVQELFVKMERPEMVTKQRTEKFLLAEETQV